MSNKNMLWAIGMGATISLVSFLTFSKAKKSLKAIEPDLALKASKIMFESPGRVLAVSPHPDDLDFFAGGTIKRLVDSGFEVTVVDVSNGERGVNIPNLGSIRQHEQKNAQRILGYKNLKFLHYPDMKVNYKRLMRDLRNVWYETDPDIVFTFDPNFPLKFLTHKDHLAVGKAVCKLATEMDSNVKIYLYGSRKNNILVDISQSLDKKIEATLSHKSQLRFSSSIYKGVVRKMSNYAAIGSDIEFGETFRAFHNFDSFPM